MASQPQAAGEWRGAAALVTEPPPRPAATGPRVVVRTSGGQVAGEHAGGVCVFRGIPYARPPLGPLRFASPRPPEPWSGVREAVRFSPVSFQAAIPNRPVPPGSEDSLYANVFTPAPTGSRPVLVYVHGGGWQAGAGSMPAYDGTRLAERGDLVVVTFNYRLGVLGFGLHEDLADAGTGHAANWGLQDQAALLHWVRDNAAAFGGDPDDITVCGTSAGGATAWQLSLLPAVRGLVRRLVCISPSHATAPGTALTPEDSHAAYAALARRLGTTVAGLREVPAGALTDAWTALFAPPPGDRIVSSGRWYRGPVVDGRTMPAPDHLLPTPDVPVLSVHTSTEGSFYTGPAAPDPLPAPRDEAELVRAVREVLSLAEPEADEALAHACAAAHRSAARQSGLPDDPRSLWTEIWGDAFFRHQIVRFADRHARLGRTPLYAMEFAHPARAPHFGTPHEATSPFLFGTHRLPQFAGMFGDGPAQRLLSDVFVDIVAAFARTSAPHTAHTPDWPPYTPGRPSTLVLGGPRLAEVTRTPKLAQLDFWDAVGWSPRP
ncbi:carboxylesterase family protein [Streptomyces sp. NPDC049954]|uniref:carboxylesterase/lipase family protein n=1 Tax=Streptomyces sp. NPDC049954 TaxID=3155779 RepID=UPI0034229BC3